MELLQEMELEKEVICGKVQEKFHISSQEAAQEVEKYWEVGSMGDWEYPHKMFQAFMSNQFADCRDTKCGLT